MHSKSQSHDSVLSIVLVAAAVGLFVLSAVVSAKSQSVVPRTAREAAQMPEFAQKLARRGMPQNAGKSPSSASKSRGRHGSPQDQVIYENGPVNGTTDAWTINFGYVLSDTFVPNGSTVTGFDIWVWEYPGDTMTSVDWSITSDANGGTVYGSGTVSGSYLKDTYISTNQYGYNIDKISASGLGVPASGTVWLNLFNATVPSGDPVYWDENSGAGCKSQGCPSQAVESGVGTIPSEAFDVTSCEYDCPPPPCFNENPQNGFQVIHDFSGGQDGGYLDSRGVTIDKSANLYGMACADPYYCGVAELYKLSRKGQDWMFSSLLVASWGDNVSDWVIVGSDGSLYGAGGSGSVFNLRPSPIACLTGRCPWTDTALYRFTGGDDASLPTGVLTFDQAGVLYGTSRLGGGGNCYYGAGCGTVYELTPSSGGWTEKVLYSWKGDGNGAEPSALLVGIDGNLYGRTDHDGDYGYGTVYQLAPSGDGWAKTILYSFDTEQDNYGDGIAPRALVQDSAGNLYGVARGVAYPFPTGIVFMLSPSDGKWVFTILRNNNDSGDLFNNLTMDEAGNLYGTGGLGRDFGCGRSDWCFAYIFKLVHANGGWQYSTPVYFSGQLFQAFGTVALDAQGNLYGTTNTCGKYNYGTVWQLSP